MVSRQICKIKRHIVSLCVAEAAQSQGARTPRYRVERPRLIFHSINGLPAEGPLVAWADVAFTARPPRIGKRAYCLRPKASLTCVQLSGLRPRQLGNRPLCPLHWPAQLRAKLLTLGRCRTSAVVSVQDVVAITVDEARGVDVRGVASRDALRTQPPEMRHIYGLFPRLLACCGICLHRRKSLRKTLIDWFCCGGGWYPPLQQNRLISVFLEAPLGYSAPSSAAAKPSSATSRSSWLLRSRRRAVPEASSSAPSTTA